MRALWMLLCVPLLAFGAEVARIGSFESDQDMPLVPAGAKTRRVTEHATDGQFAWEVVLPGAEKDTWPGVILRAGDMPDWSQRDCLLLDLYLFGNQRESLGVRIDSADGRNVFDSLDVHPGLNRNAAISIKGHSAEVDLKHTKQLLLYKGKPRQDVVFTIDNLRWGKLEQRLVRQVHRPTLPKPQASAAQTAAGFIAYAQPWMAFSFPTDRPAGEVASLSLFSAQGQREPLGLSVYALRDLAGVTVTVGDLRGPGQATLPASAWARCTVEPLSKKLAYSGDKYVVDMPTWLAPHAAPVKLAADRTRTFQLTLATPAAQAPGVYRGRVTVTADGRTRDIPLAVRVLPFGLPELPGYFYGEYYRLNGRYTDSAAKIRADLADMRAHEMTSVGLCIGVSPSSYTVTGEQVTFRFAGDTPFEWVMTAYKDLGFPSPIVLLSDSGQDACAAAGLKRGDAAYDRLYVNWHRAFAQALQDKGWARIYIQPMDEVGWGSRELQEQNTHLLRILHEAGISTEVDGPPDKYLHEEAGPFADIWCCNGRIGPQEVVDKAVAAGKIVLTYNNDTEGYTPEADRWAYGLFNWRNHLRGGYDWEYRGVGGDPYDDFDTKYADFLHQYPADATHPGGPSRGWEGSRSGVDDRRYLVLLESLIAKAQAAGRRAAGVAAEAQAMLDDLRGRLDDNRESYRHRCQWAAEIPVANATAAGLAVADAEAQVVVTGDRKMPNGLTQAEFDTVRWMVAVRIAALQQALGMGPGLDLAMPSPARPQQRVTVVARGAAADSKLAPRPTLAIPALPTAPTLDGTVDGDPGWTGAAKVQLTRSDGSGPTDMPTTVRCGLHGGRFYVAFDCAEVQIGRLTAQVKATDGPVWDDDCVEVFLDPGLTGKRYYQVLANSLGTISRLQLPNGKWTADIQAKAKVDNEAKRWLVELSIPTAGLNLAPKFGLNFGRERRPFEAFELSTWSVTGGPFGKPERFGIGLLGAAATGAPLIAPKLALQVLPSYIEADQAATDLRFDVTVDASVAATSKLTLKIEGKGLEPIVADVPGPLAERMAARLAVGDLPPGDYTVTATLTAPGAAPVAVSAKLTRVPAVVAP